MIHTQKRYRKDRSGEEGMEGGGLEKELMRLSFSSFPCGKAVIWASRYTSLLFCPYNSSILFFPEWKKEAAKPHTLPAGDAEMRGAIVATQQEERMSAKCNQPTSSLARKTGVNNAPLLVKIVVAGKGKCISGDSR